jgi:hypothetical protein
VAGAPIPVEIVRKALSSLMDFLLVKTTDYRGCDYARRFPAILLACGIVDTLG